MERLRKTTEALNQGKRYPGLDFNPRSSEYGAEMLPTRRATLGNTGDIYKRIAPFKCRPNKPVHFRLDSIWTKSHIPVIFSFFTHAI
jgi:hypothetical protein